MNDLAFRNFFLQPTDTWHRRYEALRVYFVEQQPLADVAQPFLVEQFQRQQTQQRRRRWDHLRPWIISLCDESIEPQLSQQRPEQEHTGVSRAEATTWF